MSALPAFKVRFHIHAVPTVATRGPQITWPWSYGQQLSAVSVLGSQPGSSEEQPVLPAPTPSLSSLNMAVLNGCFKRTHCHQRTVLD